MATPITTAADLNTTVRNNPGGSYIQTANISLSGYNWVPIENFTGTYDGAGYAINNFYMSRPQDAEYYYYALFKNLTGATVKNIRLIDINIQMPYDPNTGFGGIYTAGVGGEAVNTTFENCYVTGVINGTLNGGICGEASGCSFGKCATKIDFTGYAYFWGNYEGSFYDIETVREGSGIVNYPENGTTIKDCYARMTFDGGQPHDNPFKDVDRWWSGGVSMYLRDSSVENCYATGIDTISDPKQTSGSSISNSYYPGSDSGGNGTARSVAQMTHPESFGDTYIGWDFTNIWVSDPSYTINNGYPHFGAGWNIWVNKGETLNPNRFNWLQVIGVWVKKNNTWEPVESVSVGKNGLWKNI